MRFLRKRSNPRTRGIMCSEDEFVNCFIGDQSDMFELRIAIHSQVAIQKVMQMQKLILCFWLSYPLTYDKVNHCSLHLEKVYISLQHNFKGLLFKTTCSLLTSIWSFMLSLGYGHLPFLEYFLKDTDHIVFFGQIN